MKEIPTAKLWCRNSSKQPGLPIKYQVFTHTDKETKVHLLNGKLNVLLKLLKFSITVVIRFLLEK